MGPGPWAGGRDLFQAHHQLVQGLHMEGGSLAASRALKGTENFHPGVQSHRAMPG